MVSVNRKLDIAVAIVGIAWMTLSLYTLFEMASPLCFTSSRRLFLAKKEVPESSPSYIFRPIKFLLVVQRISSFSYSYCPSVPAKHAARHLSVPAIWICELDRPGLPRLYSWQDRIKCKSPCWPCPTGLQSTWFRSQMPPLHLALHRLVQSYPRSWFSASWRSRSARGCFFATIRSLNILYIYTCILPSS